MTSAWKEGDQSTPENLPGRLMWFDKAIRDGKPFMICIAAPFVEAAEEIKRLRRLLDHPAIVPTGINWRNADNNETTV